jgi:biotin carboxylase
VRRRALVLGGIADVLEPPRRLGIETIFFQRQEGMRPEFADLADECQVVPFDNHDAVLRRAEEAYRDRPFDCVVSFSELAMIPAAMIAERLGLPGASTVATARLLRDKLAMRGTLNAAGLSPVRSCLVRSVDDARKLADAAGYPVILKPRFGTGSMGVRRVDSAAELPAAVAAVLTARPQEFLAEEFLSGPEFSVEAFSFDGVHCIVAITEKQVTAGYVESGHVVPAAVTAGEDDAIRELTAEFLDLAGVTDGPSHTEVILSDGRPRIVESHDRLGGDKIFRLVELAYGVSLLAWCYQWPLAMMTAPPQPPAVAGACIKYLLPPPGRVTSISVPDAVRADKSLDQLELDVAVGDQVRPLACSLDRAGFVVTSAADRSAAVEAAERLTGGIGIETVPA